MQSDVQQDRIFRESLERKHEVRNPPVGGIFFAAALMAVMTVACMAIIWSAMRWFAKSRALDKTITTRGIILAPDAKPLERFPLPTLQLNPQEDLIALRVREDKTLTNYGWVDRSNGVVRIPIERAMELLAQRGLPTRTSNAPARVGKSSLELIEERSRER